MLLSVAIFGNIALRYTPYYDGYITNVYTRPAYRGRGIGSALMQHVKAWALEQEFGTLFVWPSTASRNYYARAGFIGGSEVMEYEVRPYVL